jgi:hypothetical protein
VAGPEREAALVSFLALASLLMPTEPGPRALALEADARWQFDRAAAADADLVVWGRPPWPSGTSLPTLARAAIARERALTRLRRQPPGPLRVVAIHRWWPPALRPDRGASKLRDAFLSGALVELAAARRPLRVIDAASQMAAGSDTVRGFLPGSGGSALTRVPLAGGREGVLRVAPTGGAGDPARAAAALHHLAGEPTGQIPRLLGRGITAGASWSLESYLPGRRPSRLTPAILVGVARFVAALPRAAGPPTAHHDDLDRIATAYPQHAPVLQRISRGLDLRLRSLPAVVRHGDLWTGNLLATGMRLSGVVDWDGWHPSATPGVDLLQLLNMDEALRTRRHVGELWLQRPWESPVFARVSAEYWQGLGVRPDRQTLEAIGIAWWAGQVAHSLSRDPTLSGDRRWTEAHLDRVLGVIEGLIRP